MVELVELNKEVPFATQLEEKVGPVVSLNIFHVEPEVLDKFIEAWAADGAVMKRQPGFISAQLHRGVAGSNVLMHYTVWESTEHLKQAYNNPEFQAALEGYPAGATASPHVFRKIEVPGLCLAD
ncbi:antibiotic biosynthesis monooxygenase [Ktedonosporobacter rubrisoli]|uniref:Antibiotic biosynthesis monooxygenase n=1 Tax=Ktedonosporobacter rubrisoli TaxID=2509675 RepID=A0A4P6JZ09_KTERU|nr:antibiotic biosynthesis monooxygenase family protein [Ktedonosporobacter rubrisoli]QBD81098.1 antibiotic biosynthesis monooxygenase [Ktedonosporobacter rubrisoli]